ncbi:MAG: hypothetical protein ACREMQ_02055 [Longimicrobiales bacterium]
MKLESVLGLKAELRSELQPAIPAMPAVFSRTAGPDARRSAFAARVSATHTRSPKSEVVALGVAAGRTRNDFKLGARIHVAGPRGRALAKSINERARGEADVRIVPKVRKRTPTPAWFRRRRRPLEAGVSCGHFKITAGTLGFIAEDKDAFYILSNNHVLANVNTAQPGDPIVQPGPDDVTGNFRVSSRTLIGVLDRFVPISFQRSNVVDCAVAEVLPDLDFYAGWTESLPGLVRGVRSVTVGDLGRPVSKAGRTTGVTRGTINQVNIDRLRVDLGEEGSPMDALFSDQIEIVGAGNRAFSDGGDSGSLIVSDDGFARALLFCGGPDENGNDLTYANPIDKVLEKLGVTLVV